MPLIAVAGLLLEFRQARQRRFDGFRGPFGRLDRTMVHAGTSKERCASHKRDAPAVGIGAGRYPVRRSAGGDARAQAGATGSPSCAAAIRAVQADIAARDLDTSARTAAQRLSHAQSQAPSRRPRRSIAGPRPASRGTRLFCVPVAVKDNFNTYDMPTTVGSLALIGNQPPRDAPFVARLREAGAIIVGKTNMDEFAMGIRGLSGRRRPRRQRLRHRRRARAARRAARPSRSARASSRSPSAATIAARCGIPAVYNGAVTLRATYGRFDVPRHLSDRIRQRRAGRDRARNRARCAPRSPSPATAGARTRPRRHLRGKRIGIVLRRFDRKDPWSPAEPETQKLFRQAIALMRNAGADIVEDIRLDDFDARLGPGFLKGFARRVDAAFATYPGRSARLARRVSRRGAFVPEWSAKECMAIGASRRRWSGGR